MNQEPELFHHEDDEIKCLACGVVFDKIGTLISGFEPRQIKKPMPVR